MQVCTFHYSLKMPREGPVLLEKEYPDRRIVRTRKMTRGALTRPPLHKNAVRKSAAEKEGLPHGIVKKAGALRVSGLEPGCIN